MATCFVIQPFDGGKFDKRYADTFKPAIEAAGYEAYRVDRDPSIAIPITEIQAQIEGADVCFAEITLDNPNVWFELGYSFASGKDVCMICSEERTGKYPFNIQHRSIISYKVGSTSDFEDLKSKISLKLRAISIKEKNLKVLNPRNQIENKVSGGLSKYEVDALCSILANMDCPDGSTSHYIVKRDMEKLGLNAIAVNVGVQKLRAAEFIELVYCQEYNEPESYPAYKLLTAGWNWINSNESVLDFQLDSVVGAMDKKTSQRSLTTMIADDIPF
jgi:hypothetical protein